MKRGGKLAEKWQRFMQGRYGADHFSRFISIGGCVLIVLALLLRSVGNGALTSILSSLAMVSLVWCYYRMFSRKYEQRQKENLWYLRRRAAVTGWFSLQKERFRQRKEYVFFRCPGCKTVVRLPRKKGHIRITCRHCGYTFEKRT